MDEISYKDKIEKFLKDERHYCLLIKGKWGSWENLSMARNTKGKKS